ncbi:serine/threonine-protein kinase [Streptomyces sp. NBC_01619]|uniref:serine/threonine-protein kinase n=1 Tax=Streptomyces sp. NBC_01619 TaxID=2975901 RepID=UPI0022565B5C|nr:serine/threonine-protein kinase [Streptomyces sp. NBC_01619]MCX4509362.1 serine/threonine-protein kinase [Streptomyces sp. NBC_01619]
MTGANEAAGRVITERYRLLRRLGTGGMGRVWLAYDQELACEVALKEIILPPDVPEHEVGTKIARARCEARHAARLRNHPNVVTVHDIVEDGGLPWIVMDFVPGAMDLEAVVHKWGPLPPADVARIGLAVLDALLEGHRLGILHRDVKPANILLTHPNPEHSYPTEGGQVLLTDYGIALEPNSGEARLTATLEVLGTPRFMAPERAHSNAPTPAADLFSLGATLYFAVEGSGPFDRDSFLTTLTALMSEPPIPPRRAAELTLVLLGLLAKDPANRMDGDKAAQQLTFIAAQPQPPPSQQLALPPVILPPEGPPTSKQPRLQESAPTTEHVPPTEPEEPAGPPPAPLPRKADEARPQPRPLRAGHRRAGLIAGVVALALAAVGGGIYLAQSPSSDSANPELSSIQVGNSPSGVALSPDGRRVYVTNFSSDSVSVIDTATNRTVDDPIPVGNSPSGVAVSPDGRRVYVTNNDSASVSVIDATKNRTMGNPIPVGDTPEGVAVSRDGRVYVANGKSDSVSVIDPVTNRTVGNPIRVGRFPAGVAVSPNGRRVYVTSMKPASVTVIDTATNRTVGSPIPVEKRPTGVAVSPDGRRVYVTNFSSDSVSVIDTATNRTVGSPLPVEKRPTGVAVSPDGHQVYVTNGKSDSVSEIDPATNLIVDTIPVGISPEGVAVSTAERQVYVTNKGSDSVSVITF